MARLQLHVYLITPTLGLAVEPMNIREVGRDAQAVTYRFESDVYLVERESEARPWERVESPSGMQS